MDMKDMKVKPMHQTCILSNGQQEATLLDPNRSQIL